MPRGWGSCAHAAVSGGYGRYVGWLVTLGAAVWLGFGFVLQQRAAEAQADVYHPVRLIFELVRQPSWVVGIACMVCGQALSAWALGHWDLTFVEPVLSLNVVFALLLAIPLAAQWLRWREVLGVLLLVAGVSVFTVVSRADGAVPAHQRSDRNWLAAAVIAGLALALVRWGWRRPAYERATVVGAAAGLIFGIQDALTRRVVRLVTGDRLVHMLTSWPVYGLLAAAVIGILLMQDAFGSAPLRASLPALTAAEPIAGIVLGVLVFGDAFRLGAAALAGEVAALAAMVAGVVLVGRAPVLVERVGGGATYRSEEGGRR